MTTADKTRVYVTKEGRIEALVASLYNWPGSQPVALACLYTFLNICTDGSLTRLAVGAFTLVLLTADNVCFLCAMARRCQHQEPRSHRARH